MQLFTWSGETIVETWPRLLESISNRGKGEGGGRVAYVLFIVYNINRLFRTRVSTERELMHAYIPAWNNRAQVAVNAVDCPATSRQRDWVHFIGERWRRWPRDYDNSRRLPPFRFVVRDDSFDFQIFVSFSIRRKNKSGYFVYVLLWKYPLSNLREINNNERIK